MLLVSGTVWTAIAMLWIHGLNLRYPAPFIGMPGRMSGIFSAFYVLSHSFPKPWPNDPYRCPDLHRLSTD